MAIVKINPDYSTPPSPSEWNEIQYKLQMNMRRLALIKD